MSQEQGGGGGRRGGAGLGIAAVAAAAFAVSWIYGPLEHYSPLVYLNLLLTYLAAAALGKAAERLLRAMRIDRPGVATAVGVVGGATLLWFSWLSYLCVIAGWDFGFYFDLLAAPSVVVAYMRYLAAEPIWNLGGSGAAPAIMYYLVWLAEAASFIVVPCVMARKFLRDNRRCDDCGRWLGSTGDLALFAMPEPATLTAIREGNVDGLAALPRLADDSASAWLEVQGYACPDCEDKNGYVGVYEVRLKEKKDKEPERTETALARFIPVDVDLERALFEPALKAEGESVEPSPEQ